MQLVFCALQHSVKIGEGGREERGMKAQTARVPNTWAQSWKTEQKQL